MSKRYQIRHRALEHVTLAESAMHRLRHPLQRSEREDFWALSDIDLELARGEVLGLIGRNGSGKSTLLKVITRITEPTTGRIDLWGRVGSLLEVGTGFHPELTGRENVYLNGSILGMTTREITRQFDAIVEFAGVSQFLDTPVKRYSSGMYVRLAFAIAAHLDTEILLVDEVLAVGDIEFQRKCLAKMEDVSHDGRTIIFVSHHLPSIEALCDRCLILTEGRGEMVADASIAVRAYLDAGRAAPSNPARRVGTGEVRVAEAQMSQSTYRPEDPKVLHITAARTRSDPLPYFVSVHLVSDHGYTVAHCDSRLTGTWGSPDPTTNFTLELTYPWLKPGNYHADIYICSAGVLDAYEQAAGFTVETSMPYPVSVGEDAIGHSVTLPTFSYATSVPGPRRV